MPHPAPPPVPPPHAPPEEGGVGVLVQYGLQLPQSEGRLGGERERSREIKGDQEREIKIESERADGRQ